MKVLRVSNGDYQVVVQNSGTITLNTGVRTGTVLVTGNLTVQGTTTTVQSETMTVKDNIIVLNSGETGSTVTLGTSGIQVDRGSGADAQILWDESETHYSPTTATTVPGTWVFRRDNGTLTGIQTNSIDTNQGVLGLINSGSTGYVTVTGTGDYEQKILNYVDPSNPALGVSVIDDDRIPNAKAMSDYVASSLASFVAEVFGAGDTLGQGFDTVRFQGVASCSGTTLTVTSVTAGYIKVGDFIAGAGIPGGTTVLGFIAASGGAGTYQISASLTFGAQAITAGDAVSKLTFKVDNVLKATIDSTGLIAGNLTLATNTLSSTSGSIILDPTNSKVSLDGHLELAIQGSAPSSAATKNIVYHASSGAGDSGVFYITTARNDELVSKRRAILFGMIF
jgi:hypothetical protein